jgi:hypothetical protein
MMWKCHGYKQAVIPVLLVHVTAVVLAYNIVGTVGTADLLAAEQPVMKEKNNKCSSLLGGGGGQSTAADVAPLNDNVIVVGALGIKGEGALFRQWNATFSTCVPSPLEFLYQIYMLINRCMCSSSVA